MWQYQCTVAGPSNCLRGVRHLRCVVVPNLLPTPHHASSQKHSFYRYCAVGGGVLTGFPRSGCLTGGGDRHAKNNGPTQNPMPVAYPPTATHSQTCESMNCVLWIVFNHECCFLFPKHCQHHRRCAPAQKTMVAGAKECEKVAAPAGTFVACISRPLLGRRVCLNRSTRTRVSTVTGLDTDRLYYKSFKSKKK